MSTNEQMLEALAVAVRSHLADHWFMVGDVSAARGDRMYQLSYEMTVGDAQETEALVTRFEPCLSSDWSDTRLFYRRLPIDVFVSVLHAPAPFGVPYPDSGAAWEVELSQAAETRLRRAFMAAVYIPITFQVTRSFAEQEMRYTLRIKLCPTITMEVTITQSDDSILHTSANSNIVWMMLHQMFSEALAQATHHLFPDGMNVWADRLSPVLTAAAEGREYGRAIPPGHPIPPIDTPQQTVLLVPSYSWKNLDELGCLDGRQVLKFYRPRSRKEWEQGKFGIETPEYVTPERRAEPFKRPPRKMLI